MKCAQVAANQDTSEHDNALLMESKKRYILVAQNNMHFMCEPTTTMDLSP